MLVPELALLAMLDEGQRFLDGEHIEEIKQGI